MFGAINAGLLIQYGVSVGMYHQLHLDLECPPWVFVKPEYLTSVNRVVDYVNSVGSHCGVHGTVDHPTFAATRDWLESQGYIKCERNWWNGDRVIKPFYFNNVYEDVGEQFSCGAAMAYGHSELYNEGKPLPIPNYKQPDDLEW